jgi:hypothetical protein
MKSLEIIDKELRKLKEDPLKYIKKNDAECRYLFD